MCTYILKRWLNMYLFKSHLIVLILPPIHHISFCIQPHPVYPCIAFACPNCHVSVNFGHHKFAYNIGQYIARERAVAISTAVDRKCNDQLAYVTMRK